MSLVWCRSGWHVIPEGAETARCDACNIQNNYRNIARKRKDGPFCSRGHGLVRGNIGPDGECAECDRYDGLAVRVVPPADPTWLDWAAVHSAINRRPLLRPLTHRELACLITTLRATRPDWTIKEVVDWIASDTEVPAISITFAEFLLVTWWRRKGYPDPRITVEQAMFAEADGAAWIAEAEKAAGAEKAA